MPNEMGPSTALFLWLEPILLTHGGASLCVLVQLVSMYFMGLLAGVLLPVASPRVATLPTRRQKQLAIAFPVIALKAVVMVLIVDTIFAGFRSHRDNRSSSIDAPSLDYRFQTLCLVAASYVFELLQRPSSVELVLHHVYLQSLPFYYWFWLRNRPEAHADLVVRFFELMVLLGPGATDITSDITFLLYYSAPRSWSGLAMVKGMSWIATISRAVQWVVLATYVHHSYTDALGLLSSVEIAMFVVSVTLWVWTEVDEILKIRGMVGKFEGSLVKKMT